MDNVCMLIELVQGIYKLRENKHITFFLDVQKA